MVQLYCNCLNVGIHCKESMESLQQLSANNDNCLKSGDTFFANCVSVTLALAGITTEHEYLCWTRVVGQWAINHCSICKCDTHATHIDNDNQRKILVNKSLEGNASRIETLRSHHNYSQLFRVIIPSTVDNLQSLSRGNKSGVPVEVETKKRLLQQRVQRYISAAQKEMEDRIRTYTEQEHSKFADMQLKIGRNEEVLIDILNSISDKLTVSRDPNTTRDANLGVENGIVDNHSYQDSPNVMPQQTQSAQIRQLGSANRQINARQPNPRYRSQSMDYDFDGYVFDIDIEAGNEFDSVAYSDDEDEDGLAFRSSVMLNGSRNRANQQSGPQTNAQPNAQNGHFAYSLPIQVPQWRTINHSIDTDDEENVPSIEDEEAIAESIKQLAKSVRNDTDIFGDRPRRRLNTGDLIKSRPQ